MIMKYLPGVFKRKILPGNFLTELLQIFLKVPQHDASNRASVVENRHFELDPA